MSIKSKVLAAAAALVVVGGVSTVGALSASAATPGCSQNGSTCVQIFSKRFGTPASPGFVESVFLGIPFAGVPTILQRTSSSNPAGDMIIPAAGTVSQFYAKGMVSAAANSHYGAEKAVQVEYAPRGKPTGLCAAIATRTPYQNEGLTLQPCTHAALIAEILDLLAGNEPAPPSAGRRPPLEALSYSEIRVLRYLPTNLSASEIAIELSVSTSTVKTHMRNLYTKLGAHRRAEAIESARALGLLAPSAYRR